jgi:hypothetical protein
MPPADPPNAVADGGLERDDAGERRGDLAGLEVSAFSAATSTAIPVAHEDGTQLPVERRHDGAHARVVGSPIASSPT